MKWISLSKTAEFQHFVFVDAPEEAQDIDMKNLCPESVLSDFKNALATLEQDGLTQFVSYRAKIARLAQQPYTAYPYQKAFSRGPPVFSWIKKNFTILPVWTGIDNFVRVSAIIQENNHA